MALAKSRLRRLESSPALLQHAHAHQPPRAASARDSRPSSKWLETPSILVGRKPGWWGVDTFMVVLLVLYLGTGAVQPTLVDWIKYQGASGLQRPPALFTLLTRTVGMALVAPMLMLSAGWRKQCGQGAGAATGTAVKPAARARVDSGGVGKSRPGSVTFASNVGVFDRRVILPALVDLTSGMLCQLGLLVVGSGVYVVLYSSCTAWTAIASRVWLHKRLSRMQWAGVALCTVGLLLSGLTSAAHHTAGVHGGDHVDPGDAPGPSLHLVTDMAFLPAGSGLGSGSAGADTLPPSPAIGPPTDLVPLAAGSDAIAQAPASPHLVTDLAFLPDGSESASGSGPAIEPHQAPGRYKRQSTSALVLGGVLVVLGSALHSAMFVIVESMSSRRSGRVAPHQLCIKMGMFQTCLVTPWVLGMLAYYSPAVVVGNELAAHGTSTVAALVMYVWLTCTNAVHALSFFFILGRLGAVGSSILKGAQSVIVFLFSALFYCQYQASQCATWPKTLSMVVVVAGTLAYSLARPHAGTAPGRGLPSEAERSAAALGLGMPLESLWRLAEDKGGSVPAPAKGRPAILLV